MIEMLQPSNAPCLRELNLADNMLGDDGVEGMSVGLEGHPCLEILVTFIENPSATVEFWSGSDERVDFSDPMVF